MKLFGCKINTLTIIISYLLCNYKIVLIFSLLGQAESGRHDTGCEHWILPWHYLRWGRYTNQHQDLLENMSIGEVGDFWIWSFASNLGFWWIFWEILCPSLIFHKGYKNKLWGRKIKNLKSWTTTLHFSYLDVILMKRYCPKMQQNTVDLSRK